MLAALSLLALAVATDAPPAAAVVAAERVLEADGDRAVALELPITKVTVFSDRARVTRSGPVRWGALAWPTDAGAPKVVRVPDLPGAVLSGSLRVTATGAKVVRVEAQPVERERWSIEQVDAFLADLEKVNDQIALASGRLDVTREAMAFLASVRAAAPVPEKDRLGKGTPVIAPEAWRAVQEWLAKRRTASRAVETASEAELRTLSRELVRLQREVQRRELGAATDQKLQVTIIVETERSDGTLTVEYAVPGALWRPAYELFFEPDGGPDGGKLELLAAGLVSQATGEEWRDVKLALSTAMPSLGIAMPTLHTWTLGDDREWVPRPSARTPPRRATLFAPPARRAALADIERAADKAVLESRMALLSTVSTSPPAAVPRLPSPWRSVTVASATRGKAEEPAPDPWEGEAEEDNERADLGGAGRAYREAQGAPTPSAVVLMPRPPPAAEPSGVEMGRPGAGYKTSAVESADDFELDAAEVTTKSIGRVRSGPSAVPRGLALNPGRGWGKQELFDPTLPAVAAGGFDWVYDAPLATTVPSEAEQLRVPLASRSYQVQTFYEATPSLAKTAYLKAAVRNGGKLPILAGPANVFVNRTFTGDALLATTGPGGTLELPLGADENIRLTRSVVPATRTQGFLIGEEDVTDYAVKIEVGNYKRRAITVRVIDQIPRTNDEKIKIELVAATPTARAKPDADGLLYWHVDVPAGGTKTVTFTFRITRPKGWRLTQ